MAYNQIVAALQTLHTLQGNIDNMFVNEIVNFSQEIKSWWLYCTKREACKQDICHLRRSSIFGERDTSVYFFLRDKHFHGHFHQMARQS